MVFPSVDEGENILPLVLLLVVCLFFWLDDGDNESRDTIQSSKNTPNTRSRRWAGTNQEPGVIAQKKDTRVGYDKGGP